MQKRSRILDSYELEERIRETDDERLKFNMVQSGFQKREERRRRERGT
jgi:hypothetical protein